jgi:hypothetical protein
MQNSVSEIMGSLISCENVIKNIMYTVGNAGNVSLRYNASFNPCVIEGQNLLNAIDYLGENFNRGNFSVYNDFIFVMNDYNQYVSKYT